MPLGDPFASSNTVAKFRAVNTVSAHEPVVGKEGTGNVMEAGNRVRRGGQGDSDEEVL